MLRVGFGAFLGCNSGVGLSLVWFRVKQTSYCAVCVGLDSLFSCVGWIGLLFASSPLLMFGGAHSWWSPRCREHTSYRGGLVSYRVATPLTEPCLLMRGSGGVVCACVRVCVVLLSSFASASLTG